MTLQDLGSLGELVAAIATVATLLYLAAQIKQGAQAVRSHQSQEFVRWRTDMLQPVVADRDLTALWLAGSDGFDDLDPVDQRRLIFFEWRAISGWSHYYRMRRRGLIEDEQWAELLFLFQRIGSRRAMRAAWEDSRAAYSEDFQAFMDPYLTRPQSNTEES